MAAAASVHVTAALGALRNAGVYVEWVQLGNETRSGMLYQKPNGTDISSSAHTAKVLKNPTGAKNFVTIFSAAAAAAKSSVSRGQDHDNARRCSQSVEIYRIPRLHRN